MGVWLSNTDTPRNLSGGHMEVTERVISLSDWNLGYVEGKLETF